MGGVNSLRWDLGEGGEGQKGGSKDCLNERRDEAHLNARMNVAWIKECRDERLLVRGERKQVWDPTVEYPYVQCFFRPIMMASPG